MSKLMNKPTVYKSTEKNRISVILCTALGGVATG